MDTIHETSPKKTVYAVIDREEAHNIWVKIGVGWVNRDGSLNIRLDALPTSNKLQIRDVEQTRQ